MSDLGSLSALLADIAAKVTTNGANENTGARVRACLENIADTVYGSVWGRKGTNIASAATTDIGAATGDFVHITGTTTITALGTSAAGQTRKIVFDGILTLTHNATSLILPTGANITTAAGDTAVFISEGSGNWRCVNYSSKSGLPLVLTQAIVDGLNASNVGPYAPSTINPYITAEESANSYAPIASVPNVWVADCLDFSNPGANTTVLKTQLGTVSIATNGTGDYEITSSAKFTTATTILLIFSSGDDGKGLHFMADFINASTISVAVNDRNGDRTDPSATTRIIINAYPA